MKLGNLCLVIFIWMTLAFHSGIALEFAELNAKPAIGNNQTIWTDIGKSIDVSCSTEDLVPIQTCYWTHTSSATNNTTKFNVTESAGFITDNLANYALNGSKLSNGSCVISIGKVTKRDFGNWSCVLVTKEHEPFSGVLQVELWEKPKFKPNIEDKPMYSNLHLLGNHKYDAKCCSVHSGKPNPKLFFTIGNLTINETSYLKFVDVNQTCITWKSANFTYKMNRNNFSCVMDHISFSDSDKQDELHRDTTYLNIQFPPVVDGIGKNRTIKLTPPQNSSAFNISVTASGNPYPKIIWSITTLRGTTDSNATDQDISPDTVTSTLIIKRPQDLQPNGSVTVYVTNKFGVTAIRYELNSNTEISNTIFIIVISVVAVLLLILVAGLIGFWVRRRHVSGRLVVPPLPKQRASAAKSRSMGEVATAEEAAPVVKPSITVDTVDGSAVTTGV